MPTEKELLEEINRALPDCIDWKDGARRYNRKVEERAGKMSRQWLMTKPFLGRYLLNIPSDEDPSLQPLDRNITYHELFGFLNAMREADLLPGSRILDVGCGPGWTSHYLGRMGYTVLGFDISEDILEIARNRIAADIYSSSEMDVRFVSHDIEAGVLDADAGENFDFALLDSVLHHFYNPVEALRNIGKNLKPGALLAIIESFQPEGAPLSRVNIAIMEQFQIIERPFTRRQMSEILRLSGFEHYVFLQGVNRLCVEPEHFTSAPDPTCVILASRKAESLGSWGGDIYSGFYEEECDDRGPYRWARTSSALITSGHEIAITFSSMAGTLGRQMHNIFISIDGVLSGILHLTVNEPEAHYNPGLLPRGTRIGFHSDFSFCPKLLGMNSDTRELAFQIRIAGII